MDNPDYTIEHRKGQHLSSEEPGQQHLKLAQENRQKHFRIEGSAKTFPFNADSFTHISVFTEG